MKLHLLRWLRPQASDPGVVMLRAARDYRPPRSVHRRMLSAVGLAGVSTFSKLAAGIGSMKGAVKVWHVAAVVGCAGAGAAGLHHRTPVEFSTSGSVPVSTTVSEARPRDASFTDVGEAPIAHAYDEGASEKPAAGEDKPLSSAEPRRRSSPPNRSTSIADELRVLEGVRGALRRHDIVHAEALLSEHSRAFPVAALGPEAGVLRIELLVARGDDTAARAAAVAFLKHHPVGVLSTRVRSILQGTLAQNAP